MERHGPTDAAKLLLAGRPVPRDVSTRGRVPDAAGIATVPCWMREMSDEGAFMALVLANSQSELSALERGLHALRSGLDVKAYAETVGRARTTVHQEVYAARVAQSVPHVRNELHDRTRHLAELHAAASWLWPTLVGRMTQRNWTVDQARAWGRVISVSSRR
jgi:ParB-like chromosome segregation protein Spo0J